MGLLCGEGQSSPPTSLILSLAKNLGRMAETAHRFEMEAREISRKGMDAKDEDGLVEQPVQGYLLSLSRHLL